MDEEAIRDHFPGARRLAYFNAAAQSLLPAPVAEAVCAAVRRAQEGVSAWPADTAAVEDARARVAALVGAAPGEVALTASTAEGLGKVAAGFPWSPGDEVVVGDLEYPSNVLPWAAQHPRGVRLRVVRSEGGRLPAERLLDAIGPRTRVLAVSQVQFTSGYRVDLDALGEGCRARGVLLAVDAIQGLGVFPVDVRRSGIGVLAGEGRKWLMAPMGTGYLVVAPEWAERLAPVTAGAQGQRREDMLAWTGALDSDGRVDLDALLRPGARKLESGIWNTAGAAGLAAALRLADAFGRDVIRARVEARVLEVLEALRVRGWPVHGPTDPAERSGIVSFEVPVRPERVWRTLHAGGVSVSVRGGRLRVAPHVYNTPGEVARLFDALDAAVAAGS